MSCQTQSGYGRARNIGSRDTTGLCVTRRLRCRKQEARVNRQLAAYRDEHEIRDKNGTENSR